LSSCVFIRHLHYRRPCVYNNKIFIIIIYYKMDPHAVLGIPPGSNITEITKAYRKLALIHHPDKNKGSDVYFKIINNAYDNLRSLQRSPPHSPQRSHQRSPPHSPQRSHQRSPPRSHQRSPPRSHSTIRRQLTQAEIDAAKNRYTARAKTPTRKFPDRGGRKLRRRRTRKSNKYNKSNKSTH
jgi:curved DNA-binding protein CbpA